MQDAQTNSQSPPAVAALWAAAELQDQLMVANNDLERLQRLLDDASQALLSHFTNAATHIEAALAQIEVAQGASTSSIHGARTTIGGAITALQFQDMATQLIAHTTQRLRSCADRLAQQAMGDDEGERALITPAPHAPNPVTQDEMDAGSVELF